MVLEEIVGQLESLVDEIGKLNSKLLLVVGPPDGSKSEVIVELARRRRTIAINVGAALGRALLSVPMSRRHIQAADLLRTLADQSAVDGVLLLDHAELLFDRTLHLNPLDLLKRLAHARRVIAVWPGQLQDSRLLYASIGHPEYRDYGTEGVVLFKI